MEEARLHKRITETKTEIFPLDRFLPLDSVYTIFHIQYEKQESKIKFVNNRVYSRLREGYYALFATLAYSISKQKPHVICFPSDPSNDFYMVELNPDKESKAYCFDVKEYTDHSDSFQSFLQQSIFPKIDQDIYDLVIGLHKAVSPREQKLICENIRDKNSSRMIYLVGAASEDNDNEDVSRVITITKNGIVENRIIDLAEYLKRLDPIVVFQDLVEFKTVQDAVEPA